MQEDKKIILGKPVCEWVREVPIVSDIIAKKETVWLNTKAMPFDMAILKSELQAEDIKDASDRLSRFSSYLKKVFPETAENDGLIESPFRFIPQMRKALEEKYGEKINGELLIKLDSHLAVSGSIFYK